MNYSANIHLVARNGTKICERTTQLPLIVLHVLQSTDWWPDMELFYLHGTVLYKVCQAC
jgi:hypothetical protein